MITFENVTKTFPDGTTAVKDLSLQIPESSFTCFVGPSGCGKTTSMRMINKMIVPTRGQVIVDGRNVADVPAVPLRLGIGYVIQNAGLLPHRTVLDNASEVLRLKGVPKKEARERGREALARVQLRPELVDRYPSQLSGGQQQRVGVARALAADPPILLMDEPFSAVDPVVREELQQEVLRLQREIRKTIVFVTHDIDEALLLGDRIAVFSPGGVVEQYADAETVLTRPASRFVAEFVGRDRGFRALSFVSAGSVPVQPLQRIDTPSGVQAPTSQESAGDVDAGRGWLLRTDADGRPTAWQLIDGDVTVPVGAVVGEKASLRTAMDAVLSSPVERGPVVDTSGRLTGFVAAADVEAAVARENPAAGDERRAPRQQPRREDQPESRHETGHDQAPRRDRPEPPQ